MSRLLRTDTGRGVARRARRLASYVALIAAISLAWPVGAQKTEGELDVTGPRPEGPPTEAPSDGVADDVDLDDLLQLPSSMSFDRQTRNGVSPEVWRGRFRESFKEIAAAEEQLAQTRRALDEAAGGGAGNQWQMGPPGANSTEVTPLSFKLREELREGRERLAEAERRHRELVIQADLAGVPADWRTAQ